MTRILVANRGEIAVRIIRTCREMGLETVAIYSDADAGAAHTQLATRAVRIGEPPASRSYLSIDRILAAASETGADAVHPGYGFLSESARFATACADAGVTFVGPPPAALALMGSKIAARDVAIRAGAPVVPGQTPEDQSDAAIAGAARTLGFPLLIKPAEGGGGIGMKSVFDARALPEAVATARREATAAFGDGTLYLERLIQRPRHVEFQVLADHHGHVLHLFERECSIQRRHQKVVEETPCTALTPALRQRMGDAAVAIARAAGYRNAGTVEFLLEGAGDTARFYFLEMNARLQVEHPITEMVTGLDLVRAQLSIAAGAPLPWTQDDLSQRGHAIEVRLYAENPAAGHLPQAGRLRLYRQPCMPGVRVDSGVREGDEVSVHYDPMIAKLIATGESREAARARAIEALRQFPVLGIATNGELLQAILQHPRFASGDLDTGFLEQEWSDLSATLGAERPADVDALAATLLAGGAAAPATAPLHDPWTSLGRTPS